MTARRADGSIAGLGNVEAQTRQVCENVKAAVEEAGGTLDDIVRVDVYVRNMEHFDIIHKVRREYFNGTRARLHHGRSQQVYLTRLSDRDQRDRSPCRTADP